ncbi:hypothetical protein [Dongia deserti]|uniref:hypothetical protein n=1 Tax=Dongia deserti TaxID=2268030 RepID=UPI000E64858F|nr:hypothetical protein [Dongia deserti]
MAKLRVKDKVELGELIIKAAQDIGGARRQLVEDPIGTLSKFVDIPADREENGKIVKHTIIVHEDTRDVTHMVLPWKDDVDRAMDRIDEQTSVYPLEYRPGTPDYIDDSRFPRKAMFFRFGEYMFGRCKHG